MLDDISITHLTFGKEFTEAVEAKQVAQQEAERARYVVEKAEQSKRAAVITSEGDSKVSSGKVCVSFHHGVKCLSSTVFSLPMFPKYFQVSDPSAVILEFPPGER
jgi:hypothetical protein